MSEDELESIREEKRKEIVERGSADGESGASDESDSPDSPAASGTPDEPIRVGSVGEFSEVTTDYGVVLVDFYADWCGPCNMLEPVVASVAMNTDAVVAKVDIDEHQGLASQFGVRSVPTLVLFADGEQVEQLVGMQDEDTLTRLVDRHS